MVGPVSDTEIVILGGYHLESKEKSDGYIFDTSANSLRQIMRPNMGFEFSCKSLCYSTERSGQVAGIV